ncbi:MAG: sulfurtransferase [Pseudomonadales bacterium]|nr:sulfurtransferase [Pseudomonadales bacterium]
METPTTGSDLLIEPDALQVLLSERKNLLLVDLSKPQVYDESHIPGAVHLQPSLLTQGEKPAPGKMPSLAQLSACLSSIGLTEESLVVAYDDEGGGWAGRLIWTLDMIGHQHILYLNGGIHAWVEAGMPIETGIQPATPSHYTATLAEHPPIMEKDEILSRLHQPDFTLWDARSPEEFSGEKCLAKKGGHIPGAINFEWTQGMDKNRSLRIKPLNELRDTLKSLGIRAEDDVLTYCQTHHRSGFTYLLAKILGFSNIKAYPGSWSEWGNDTHTPTEN